MNMTVKTADLRFSESSRPSESINLRSSEETSTEGRHERYGVAKTDVQAAARPADEHRDSESIVSIEVPRPLDVHSDEDVDVAVSTKFDTDSVTTTHTRATIIERYGPWSAMSIKLPDGSYTTDEVKPDRRLRRILQTAADISGRPISSMRVLDLACLEGQYGIEFALQGAREVVGVDIREANIVKSQFAAEQLGLDNIRFLKANVLDLSPEELGTFDLVLCSGIFYHIHQDSLLEFSRIVASLCSHVTVLDTFVSSRDVESITAGDGVFHGRTYKEHEENSSIEDRMKDVWSSVQNTTSFWLTHESLVNMLQTVGYTSVYRQELPTMATTTDDRRTYIAIKGQRVTCLSSDVSNEVQEEWLEHHRLPRLHHRNQNHSVARRTLSQSARRILPASVKDLVKPLLVRLGVVPDEFAHIKRARRDRAAKP